MVRLQATVVFPIIRPEEVLITLEVQLSPHQSLNRASAEVVARGSAEPFLTVYRSHPLARTESSQGSFQRLPQVHRGAIVP